MSRAQRMLENLTPLVVRAIMGPGDPVLSGENSEQSYSRALRILSHLQRVQGFHPELNMQVVPTIGADAREGWLWKIPSCIPNKSILQPVR